MIAGPDGEAAAGHRSLTLEEAAARHGAYRWVEHRLFELTGAWASGLEVPGRARLLLFDASAQHAWHAQLWAERLPVLAGVDPDALTRPLGDLVGPLLGALDPPRLHPRAQSVGPAASGGGPTGAAGGGPTGAAGGGPTGAAGGGPPGPGWGAVRFLAGLYRVVLPRLLDSYDRHRQALSEVADGPSIRALGFVRRDEEAELAAGEALLDAMLSADPDPSGAHAAAKGAVRPLEELIGRATGPPAPPVPGSASGGGRLAPDLVPWPDTAPTASRPGGVSAAPARQGGTS